MKLIIILFSQKHIILYLNFWNMDPCSIEIIIATKSAMLGQSIICNIHVSYFLFVCRGWESLHCLLHQHQHSQQHPLTLTTKKRQGKLEDTFVNELELIEESQERNSDLVSDPQNCMERSKVVMNRSYISDHMRKVHKL